MQTIRSMAKEIPLQINELIDFTINQLKNYENLVSANKVSPDYNPFVQPII